MLKDTGPSSTRLRSLRLRKYLRGRFGRRVEGRSDGVDRRRRRFGGLCEPKIFLFPTGLMRITSICRLPGLLAKLRKLTILRGSSLYSSGTGFRSRPCQSSVCHPRFGISDPGNMGTLIRTAPPPASTVFSWGRARSIRSIRRSSGPRWALISGFRSQPFDGATAELIAASCDSCRERAAAAPVSYRRCRLERLGAALIVGSEAHGVSAEMAELRDGFYVDPHVVRGGIA